MGLLYKFKKLGPTIFVKKMLGFEPVFSCAIRKKDGKKLYEKGFEQPFYVMPRSKKYWYADPLFYEYQGQTVLFMEALNYSSRKGIIVCSEIIDGKFSGLKKVIEESFHLSFPNIFSLNNQLFMIPEAEESRSIVIYQCEKFPDKWKLISKIKTDMPIVDSVIEKIDGNIIRFISSTYNENALITKYYYYQLDFSNINNVTFTPYEKLNHKQQESYEFRNGGRYVNLPNKKLHCVQTSTQAIYGYSLKFFDVDEKKSWIVDRKELLEVTPEKIILGNDKHKLIGVHTYTESELYEAIDIEYFGWRPGNWLFQIKKLIGII